MTTRGQRESLKVQLLDTQRLLAAVADHPVMAETLRAKEGELKEMIAALPLGSKEARTVLLFSGEPVKGSIGIDAGFAGRVLEPFQSMVMADYADRWHGSVGSRGRRPGESSSKLLLTALPRGSFGLELTKAENEQLFEEGHLADTLAHVTKLVEATNRGDEDFAAEINETSPRVIMNLQKFLQVISGGKAGLTLESGDFRCSMTPDQINEAFSRVASTATQDEDESVPGVFKGVLLESWRFDFVDENGYKITGKLDDNLTDEQVASFISNYFNRKCVAQLSKTTVRFRNGRVRTLFTLKSLEAGEPAVTPADKP